MYVWNLEVELNLKKLSVISVEAVQCLLFRSGQLISGLHPLSQKQINIMMKYTDMHGQCSV